MLVKSNEVKPLLSGELKKEIADLLDSGMICFYHIDKCELEYYPDELKSESFDSELWEETMDKIERDYNSYIKFEGMDSNKSFKMMEDFINHIEDSKLKSRFFEAIHRRKPFQQFKHLLLFYPDLRQQWFGYKQKRLTEYVEEIIDMQ
jgi:hypothetical protein